MTHEEFTQMRAGIPDYDAGIAELRIIAGGALARVIGASPVATLIHVVRNPVPHVPDSLNDEFWLVGHNHVSSPRPAPSRW